MTACRNGRLAVHLLVFNAVLKNYSYSEYACSRRKSTQHHNRCCLCMDSLVGFSLVGRELALAVSLRMSRLDLSFERKTTSSLSLRLYDARSRSISVCHYRSVRDVDGR